MDVQFKKLVAKHREMVYNACLRVVKNSADAQDATQAVFLILWQKGGKVKEPSRLAGWLYRVAVNVSKDIIKNKVARRMREEAVAGEMYDKKENAISSDVSEHLDEAIASLPEKIRTPLVLHYFEGYTHREIGNILRCPEGTVSPRINMGVSMLRSRFAKAGIAVSVTMLAQHLGSISSQAAPATLNAALDALAAKGTANAMVTKIAASAMKKGMVAKTGMAIKTASLMKTGAVAVKAKAAVAVASALIVTGTGIYIAGKNMAKTNTPPLIEIAPMATPNHVTLPGKAKLSIRASDADGNPLSYTWKKISGLGTVTFTPNGTTNSANSEAVFSAAGNYVLAAHVSDGKLTSTDSVKVLVNNPATGGLVGHWKLDETTGTTALDSSGSNNNGTLMKGPVWTRDGKLGSALSFDGVDDFVLIPDADVLDNTQKLTVAVWMRPELLDGRERGLVSKRVSYYTQESYLLFFASGNRICFGVDGAGMRTYTNTVFRPNTWYHVALIYDGTLPSTERMKLYVNGVLDKTAAESSTSIPNYVSDLCLGILEPEYFSGFKGLMDDVRIYQSALTQKEISALANP